MSCNFSSNGIISRTIQLISYRKIVRKFARIIEFIAAMKRYLLTSVDSNF